MPMTNDIERLHGRIAELEARVEQIELGTTVIGGHREAFEPYWRPTRISWKKIRPDWPDTATNYLDLVESEHRARLDENNQLRFVLSILAAVKDDGWIEWHGGECPVGVDVIAEIMFRNGDAGPCRPYILEWNHNGDSLHDIIAYRVVK